MEKKRFTKILAKADRRVIADMADVIRQSYNPVIVKEPGKTLAMIKMREPVRGSLFYIGEAIVCEASVEIDGTAGSAVLMGDDAEKALGMAVIDAAANKGVFGSMDALLELEKAQADAAARENALHLKTTVSFNSMDREAPSDLNAHKKA